ncbi:MAG: AMP-binding protein, partial [Planctomycetota bacterium]|nr:AMP-binding protein [Planctomycetota bacterium]
MGNALWLNLGEILRVNSIKHPHKIALKDRFSSLTFSQLNKRVNQLSHLLLGLGLNKGDKISCFLENCPEIVELYLACARTGIIINPINFRLSPAEVSYIINNADSKILFFHTEFYPLIESIKNSLSQIKYYFAINSAPDIRIVIPDLIKGGGEGGYSDCETMIKDRSSEEPDCSVKPEDIWVLLYTSGTTGKPKGVLRSHESYIAFYLINAGDFGFTPDDICLNVMPLCHVNTTFFSFTITYLGGSIYIHPARHFDPAEILQIIEREKITFISLIPTHYHIILSLSEETRRKYDVSSIKKLLCSSAPARGDIKKRIMEYFGATKSYLSHPDSCRDGGVQLYEGYGSTEAGIVTVLRPEEQLTKVGSIGRESSGTDCIKLLDNNHKEVQGGEVGELFSRGPMLFSGYYKLPEKTKSSFAGEWFSAGDMAKKDPDGYYYLIDRKDNMIISGGEHIYPSEVEEVLMSHPGILESAVIGIPDDKWGEKVIAVVVLKEAVSATEEEIIEYCRGKMASYKKPKAVKFITENQMPRTASGKILHRELRQ